MQTNDEAIPEAKVAFRGLLRRKLLAMTSEVAKLLAMTSEVAVLLAMMNEVTRFFAMAEDTLQGKTSLQCSRATQQLGKVKFPPVLIPLVSLRSFHTPDFLQGIFSWRQD